MAKKRLKLKDKQGNAIDYDISAASVTLDAEGKSVQVKIAELVAAIAEAVKTVVYNGEQHIVNNGRVDIGNQMQSDWSESSQSYPTFIKNKPNVVTGIKVGASGSTITPTNGVVTLPESGSQPECDTAMSSTSEAPVQNKVIKAYVDSLISGLINGAPEALDTLKELADALSDNDDAVAALTTLIGTKQNTLVSGTNIKTVNNTSLLGSGNISVADGKSAYEVYCDNVPSGQTPLSESDWLASLKGGKGDSGVESANITSINDFEDEAAPPEDDDTVGSEMVYVTGGLAGYNMFNDIADHEERITDLEEDFDNPVVIFPLGDTLHIITDNTVPWIRPNRGALKFGDTQIGGNAKTLKVAVTWKNLSAKITAAVTGTGFSVSSNSIAYSSGGRHSADLTVTFAPTGSEGTRTGTLTLTSGNTSIDIPLSGNAVAELVKTLEITPSAIELKAANGTSVEKELTVTGANLEGNVTVSVAVDNSGTGLKIAKPNETFSTDSITLTPNEIGTINQVIKVQYTAGSAGITGSVTVSATSTDGSLTDSTAVTGTVAQYLEAGSYFIKNNLKYTVLSDDRSKVSVQVSSTLPTGAVDIPATINDGDEGVTVYNSGGTATTASGLSYTVTTIPEEAFNPNAHNGSSGGATGMTSITIPNTVTSIGKWAFRGCTGLTSLTIPSSVSILGQYIVANCVLDELVYAPQNEIAIPDNCLAQVKINVGGKIDMGANVTSFTRAALQPSSSMAGCKLILRRSTMVSSGSYDLMPNTLKATLYVPSAIKSDYEADAHWQDFNDEGNGGIETIESLSNS